MSSAYLREKENTGSDSKPAEETGGQQSAGQTLGEQVEVEKPLSEAVGAHYFCQPCFPQTSLLTTTGPAHSPTS